MCYRYLIEGRVQGVFYRASAKQAADRFGLSGWVKNLADGRVESFACGELAQLNAFEQWLNDGPKLARVDAVSKYAEPCEGASAFEILPDA